MFYWWFVLICDCLTPAVMILLGRYMWKHYPKEINGLLGYRTTMSMKNMDTWSFAHEYIGKLWWKLGWLLAIPTILAHIPFYGADESKIGTVLIVVMAVQLVFLLGSVYPTEMALKRTFHEDGTFK